MSTQIQTSKNIDLTYSLIDYIVNSKNLAALPNNVTFIPFSKHDKELNAENEKLLESLKTQDTPVAIAQEPRTPKEIWTITAVNF